MEVTDPCRPGLESMSRTRVFHRRMGLHDDGPLNEGTIMSESPLLEETGADELLNAKELFIERYSVIKKALNCHRTQGVLVLAFDRKEAAIGQAWLRASLDRPRAVVLGRHSMCGLPLPSEYGAISLRHLALVVQARTHDECRIRVLDLHTRTGFRDESGRVLQALVTEGPMFLQVGPVTLIVLVTDENGLIPDNPEEAYQCIPERVFLDERLGTAGTPRPRGTSGRVHAYNPGMTLIRSRLGALASAAELKRDDEPAAGELVVRATGSSIRRPVGESALARGFLVGRYDRCDVGAVDDEDSRLSRVHLLVIREGDQIIALDTASTNGTFEGDRQVALTSLSEGTVLDLAGEIQLAWHEV